MPWVPGGGQVLAPRAVTGQWSTTRPSWTTTSSSTRFTAEQTWLGTTRTCSPTSGVGGPCPVEGDHGVVFGQCLDAGAGPSGQPPEPAGPGGSVGAEDLAAGVEHDPLGASAHDGRDRAHGDVVPSAAAQLELLGVVENVDPGSQLGRARRAGSARGDGRRRAAAALWARHPGVLQRRRAAPITSARCLRIAAGEVPMSSRSKSSTSSCWPGLGAQVPRPDLYPQAQPARVDPAATRSGPARPRRDRRTAPPPPPRAQPRSSRTRGPTRR